jgi:hypothetical protein
VLGTNTPRMKLVGGDSGHYEHEQLIEAALLAPSERVTVDLLFEEPGELPLEHHTPGRTYPLATITVADDPAEPSLQILARDDVVEPNLVWKDTVLIPTGQTVDILLEVTNPGEWVAHCHIAEHHEGGMLLNFTVDP